MSASGKVMCIRQCHIDATAKKKAAMDARNAKTAEITRLWREGFAQLKADNDRLQKERDEQFKSDMAEAGAWLADCVEGCQA